MIEIWRHIPGYEGLYKVSDAGRVRSIRAGRVLKFGYSVHGRRQVTLCRDGVHVKRQVHALVLEAFVGPCPPGLECRHGDGDHLNNRLGNLCWGTHAQNMQDKIAHGTSGKGEANPRAKLCEDDIRAIRTSPHSQRALGAAYGVSQVAIQAIQKRRTWAHVV